ncbi:hypothetical protein ZWY2020_043038 [Hordeum vulgare]|nr:hypothetical protein ZWY2020_043038 [Hordeum vulgare]
MTIRIWMQIDKSLMRGFTLETNDAAGRKKGNDGKVMEEKAEEDDGSWCRFEYEFLPDFCYRCGIIGHGEKDCEVRVCKGDMKQYGRWLRADMSSRRSSSEEGSWRSGSMGVGASRIFGHRRFGGKVGGDNDSLCWRKDGSRLTQGNDGKSDKGEEVTSPTKVRPVHQQGGKPKILVLEEMQRSSGKGGDDVVESGEKESAEGADSLSMDVENTEGHKALSSVNVVNVKGGQAKEKGVWVGGGKNPGGKRYKKRGREDQRVDREKGYDAVLGANRSLSVEEGLETEGKRGKMEGEVSREKEISVVPGETPTIVNILAGLQEQSRGEQ